MSEPGMTIEIEDVLSSIRRLVSQDAPVSRAAMPNRSAAVAVEADCLVLTPALRVEESVDEIAQEAPAAALPEEQALEPDEAVVAEAAGDTEAEALDWAEAEAVEGTPDMTEAESLLAEAEAALAEAGAVLGSAESALDDAWVQAGAEEAAEPVGEDLANLGDELARLENTIAEMEAAVADSGAEFEPEKGHPFAAEGAEPLVDLPEEFDAETFAEAAMSVETDGLAEAPEQDTGDAFAETEEVETTMAEPAAAEPEAIEEAELVETAQDDVFMVEDMQVEEEVAEAAPEDDPDLHDASWGAQESSMDWAEAALSLARGAVVSEPRRLSMADAEAAGQHAESLRSSYEDLRDEFDDEAELDDAGTGLFDEGVIDEEMLRDMVAQLIREELRGALGERITQNVRKLVRREIQRALMGQEFD